MGEKTLMEQRLEFDEKRTEVNHQFRLRNREPFSISPSVTFFDFVSILREVNKCKVNIYFYRRCFEIRVVVMLLLEQFVV